MTSKLNDGEKRIDSRKKIIASIQIDNCTVTESRRGESTDHEEGPAAWTGAAKPMNSAEKEMLHRVAVRGFACSTCSNHNLPHCISLAERKKKQRSTPRRIVKERSIRKKRKGKNRNREEAGRQRQNEK